MKTQINQLNSGFKYIIQIHQKINSWVAQKLGPTVFCYGTKKECWNVSTNELLSYPEKSVGKTLGMFLNEQGMEPLEKAEYHDVQHILFNYSMSFVDEVALQFFLRGNGIKTIATVLTSTSAWFILPFHWGYLKKSYSKGQQYKNVSIINRKTILNENLEELKMSLLK